MATKADNRWLPYGGWLDIVMSGFPIIPIGNKHIIVKLPNKGRIIKRTKEAEAFVRNVRLTCFEFSKKIKDDPVFGSLQFPIIGKECPIRVDILFMFSESEMRKLHMSDIENLAKGVLDGVKYGPVLPGMQFGLIDDDRYITAAHIEKGFAPEDGEGSRIWIRISRAGYRNDYDMSYLLQVLRPISPYDERSQGLSAKYQKIIKPETGEIVGLSGIIPHIGKKH